MGFESLRRHPVSGIFQLRKRVPAWLKDIVGKSEIKLSLGTTDRKVARIRCLEELAKIERAWSGIDASIINGEGRVLARLRCKVAPGGAPVASPDDAAADAPPSADPAGLASADKAPVPLHLLSGAVHQLGFAGVVFPGSPLGGAYALQYATAPQYVRLDVVWRSEEIAGRARGRRS